MSYCAAARYLRLLIPRPLTNHIYASTRFSQHSNTRTLPSNEKPELNRQKWKVNEKFKQSIETQTSIGANPAIKLAEEDTFGNYALDPSEKFVTDFEFEPEDDDAQDRHEAIVGDILRPGQQDFLNKLNHLIHKKRDLRSALEEMQVGMKEQLVRPQEPHFRLLIHACGKAGYTKKAFELNKEYRSRGYKRHVGIYTDLFLSCTNSPNKAYALRMASYLRKRLREDRWIPNKVNYHSMIQAFGRCGDLEESFHILDEMRQNKVVIDVDTFAHLLNGCLADKEHGFRHALLTWRMMRRKRIYPNLVCYNLMLGAAIECGMGNMRLFYDVLSACAPEQQQPRREQGLIEDNSPREAEEKWWEKAIEGSELKIVEDKEKAGLVMSKENASLLVRRPNLDNVLAIVPEDTAENRLLLMGGHKLFINQMLWEKVIPDIRTISLLLRLAPNTAEVEKEILDMIPDNKIKTDTGFYNQLVKRRAHRKDYKMGIETLVQLRRDGLEPDVITFGCIAMCCRTRKAALQLVTNVRSLGSRLNNVILGSLIRNAAIRLNHKDVVLLMKIGEQENLVPNDRIVEVIEQFYQRYRGLILKRERGGDVPYQVTKDIENDLKEWSEFCHFYKEWLARQSIDIPEHPWEQFRTSKDKDEPFPS